MTAVQIWPPTFHIRKVLSAPTEATMVPSGAIATADTPSV
jgi:hypothetical protein